MANISQLALRSVQFVFTILTLSLVGNVIDEAFAGNSSKINYAMFVSVIDMAVIIWGFLACFKEGFALGIILPIVDIIATVLTVICGIVLAAGLRVHSCGNQSYLRHNALTNGSNNPGKRCHELQASTAFYWFAFAAFAASAALGLMNRGGSTGLGRGGIRKGGPTMTQV
ncbi:related to NCE102 Protein involved in non-classical protein export pathway [Rhynchosporium secalis]|uniref:Related to NCE102 Protein involved in non-classical protein export pathway n=1 Tax=Rhynchosporium secalis TaxID=38038 RepID=A0A1E1LXA0_RHYSE|nr:related to NCE102 Protein involved in non-classical protein export pathway [Rhynchosporium secalis]